MTEAEMRERFHALGLQRQAILDISTPMRQARDSFQQIADTQINEMNEQIQQAEVGLYEIDVERAAMARALKGMTGQPE